MRPGNELDVDQDQLAAEAAAIPVPDDAPAPGAPDQPAAPGVELEPGAPAPSAWAPVTPSIVALLDKLACPAWELTADEKNELAESLAPVLDQVFPGGLGSERWAPYVRLVFVAAGITLARYDAERGKFRPLRKSRAASSSSSSTPPAPGAGDDDVPAGGFSTASH